jgi:hypothetical protein
MSSAHKKKQKLNNDSNCDNNNNNNNNKSKMRSKNQRDDKSKEEKSELGDSEDKNEQYVVEMILQHRHNKRLARHEYLVKWQGWGDDHNTWEPEDHFVHSKLLLDQFKVDNSVCNIKA